MKYLLVIVVFLYSLTSIAQFDNPTDKTPKFEPINQAVPQSKGIQIPVKTVPGLSNKDYRFEVKDDGKLGKDDPKLLDISDKEEFLDTKTDTAPNAFAKDKEATDEYDRDQVLGEIMTTGGYVNVVYRDHQSVDGDRIRVYVNDDIVQSDITLDGNFRGFDLTLEPGKNSIDFQALNQGDSGPNTAELHIYDDKGILISRNEWNLLTGRKATIVVFKD